MHRNAASISMIAAVGENGVIGKDHDMPWRLPADLAYFKRTTMGHPVIMGRRTYETIGKPLPGRTNIIVTRNERFTAKDCIVCHSADDVFQSLAEQEPPPSEVFVMGGAGIYQTFWPYAQTLYITEIHHPFDGDTYFPAFDENEWAVVSREKGVQDEKNPYDYTFVVYKRKKS